MVAAQEICTNGIDDDGDGLIDCLDPDCAAYTIENEIVAQITDDGEEESGVVELNDLNSDLDFRPGKYIGVRFQKSECSCRFHHL